MRYESVLYGDFDNILKSIERNIMTEPISLENCSDGDVRSAIRVFEDGVDFTLSQKGEQISICVNGKEDGVFGVSIVFHLIKDAIEDYLSEPVAGINSDYSFSDSIYETETVVPDSVEEDIVPDSVAEDIVSDSAAEDIVSYRAAEDIVSDSVDAEDIVADSIATEIVTDSVVAAYTDTNEYSSFSISKEADSSTILESSNTINNVSEDKLQDNSYEWTDEDDEAYKFVSRCEEAYDIEFYKGTFERIKVADFYPLGDSGESEWFVIITEYWRNKAIVAGIAGFFEKIYTPKHHDYYTMLRGLAYILTSVALFFIVRLRYFPIANVEMFFWFILFLIAKILWVCQAFRGVLYIIPFVQKWVRILEWSCGKSRFIFKGKKIPVGGSYLPDKSRGITKTDEVILHKSYIEVYYKNGIKRVYYSDCLSIFETDNLFVIMVQNNYIVPLQKKDMTDEELTRVSRILSVYYEDDSISEYSVF